MSGDTIEAGDVEDDDFARVEGSLRDRVAEDPGPALRWAAVAVLLVLPELGALAATVMGLPWNAFATGIPGASVVAGVGDAVASLPTLLSRTTIPNQGYQVPGEGWHGTFLGLSPGAAWGLRLALVYLYAGVVCWWGWRAYLTYRRHYRHASWTPRDDMVDRFRSHTWGLFGLVIVFGFVVMAVFAPALGPTTVQANIDEPFSHQITYYDNASKSTLNVSVGNANLQSGSRGNADTNVGPLAYDDFGRYHPFGTLPSGKDMFTYMVAGARVSLFIALVGLGMAAGLAAVLALVTAYYKGGVDLLVVIASDSVMSLPVLLLLILLSVLFDKTWVGKLYHGAFLLALIFGATWWPYLWRTVRGPAMQVSEMEWVEAARSYGQPAHQAMRKHMFPYIVGYMLVYASMSLGGIIISVAGLSFLGLGVTGVPEWGSAINAGQDYVTTASWHISLIPGILIVFVVTAFNALGDGIRDAIDPQSEGGETDQGSADAAATGGGA